jgi:hypothetical protein
VAEKPSDSFVSDYLSQQRDAYRKQILGQSAFPATGNTGATSLTPPEPEVGFLGGVIDFLSRPLSN